MGFTFNYDGIQLRSPAKLLKSVLSQTPWCFFPLGQYGIGSTWFSRSRSQDIKVASVVKSSVWGNFCALYALYISRYAPGMKRRRWNPELFKKIFEGQILLEFQPTLRRSKILIANSGYPFFKWLKSMGKPSDEEVYNYFDKKPPATYVNTSGEVNKYSGYNYKFFDPAVLPRKQILWAESYFPNQWNRIGPSIIYYNYPGHKLINRYSIGLHPNGYFIKNYARYRYNPAGAWSGPYSSPYESSDASFERAWSELPYIIEEEREIERPIVSWIARQKGLPAGSTETVTQKVMVDTRDNTIIDSKYGNALKYRDDLNANLKNSPRKLSFNEWKRQSFVDPTGRTRGGRMHVIETAQYPDTPPEIYFSINYANGLFQHLPKRIDNEKMGDPVYFNLGPSFKK